MQAKKKETTFWEPSILKLIIINFFMFQLMKNSKIKDESKNNENRNIIAEYFSIIFDNVFLLILEQTTKFMMPK